MLISCDLKFYKISSRVSSDPLDPLIGTASASRMGYMAQPDFGPAHIKEIEKKTAEAIDAEGWMHTGDKGAVDHDPLSVHQRQTYGWFLLNVYFRESRNITRTMPV